MKSVFDEFVIGKKHRRELTDLDTRYSNFAPSRYNLQYPINVRKGHAAIFIDEEKSEMDSEVMGRDAQKILVKQNGIV